MRTGISEQQGKILLELARKTLEERLVDGDPVQEPSDPWLQDVGATFVTLKSDGKLRGCIGNLEPVFSLWEGVCHNALNAAFNDSRFSPLTEKELSTVTLDISVLTRPEELEYSDSADLERKLRPQIDGVTLRDGARGATFLPQVWEQIPTVALFLSHLCMKAGLPKEAWRERKLEIQTYQVQYFQEE